MGVESAEWSSSADAIPAIVGSFPPLDRHYQKWNDWELTLHNQGWLRM